MSNSVQPHRRQPTRHPRPWDSPGNNSGVGCHFLLQCMKVKSESEVAQLCPTLSNPMDCRLPGSSARGIFQARELEWVALPSPYLSLEHINQFHSVKHLLDIHWYSCTVTCLPFHISTDTWCVCVVGWGSPGPSEQCLA